MYSPGSYSLSGTLLFRAGTVRARVADGIVSSGAGLRQKVLEMFYVVEGDLFVVPAEPLCGQNSSKDHLTNGPVSMGMRSPCSGDALDQCGLMGCCCLLLQYLIQSCARGGRRIVENMCYEIRRAEACVD